MDDDLVAQFTNITGGPAEHAVQYLRITDGNLEQALQLFFDTGGIDLEPTPHPTQTPSQPLDTTPSYDDDDGVVHVDSDDDAPSILQNPPSRTQIHTQSIQTPASATPPSGPQASTVEDDEAMARRLQEELFSEPGGSAALGPEGVRAPLARTTETLVGPGSETYSEDDIQAAVMAQMRARQQGPRSNSKLI
jgi:UBX domain-containing protein 7